MRSLHLALVLALTSALTLAGASCAESNRGDLMRADSGGLGDGGTGASIPIGSLAAEVTATWCDLLLTCEAVGEVALIKLFLTDTAMCSTFLTRMLTGSDFADLLDRVAAGTVLYDGNAARTCVNGVAGDCLQLQSGDSPFDTCGDVFTGTLMTGVACARSEECAGDAFCDHGTTMACPGTCAPARSAGAVCVASTECSTTAAGSGYCLAAPVGVDSTCVYRVDAAPAAAGGACGQLSLTGGVLTLAGCQAGFFCTGDETMPGNCVAPAAVGMACPSNACVAGAGCIRGTCEAIAISNAVGETCSTTSGPFCNPLRGLACQTGTCALLGDGTLGSSCLGADFADICQTGLVCLAATDTCGPPIAAGASCVNNRECASLSCDFTTMATACRADYCG